MAKEINVSSPEKSKTQLAKELGISRQSLYYQPKLPEKDFSLKTEIENVIKTHKRYGHKRIALHLGINKKRIKRVMKLFGLKPLRNRKQPARPQDKNQAPMTIPNIVKGMLIDAPNVLWVCDFTYFPFFGKFVYLSTVIDVFSRQVIGWEISTKHDANMVCQAMMNALQKYPAPRVSHSDQGSEYRSVKYRTLLLVSSITQSMSKKASPWENPYQESFYSEFKLELGHPECYENLGQLIEVIAQQIYYYNHARIHTALKYPPAVFVKKYEQEKLKVEPEENQKNLNFSEIPERLIV